MTVEVTHVTRAGYVIDFGDAVYLYDTGTEARGRHALTPWLWNRLGKRRIDGIFRSHPHFDHMEGAIRIVPRFRGKVDVFYSSGIYSDGHTASDIPAQDAVDDALTGWGVPHVHLDRDTPPIQVPGGSGATIEVITPNPAYMNPATNDDLWEDGGRLYTPHPNDHRNLAVRFVHGDFTLLMCGDLGPSPSGANILDVDARHGLHNAIDDEIDVTATVFQIPHHGAPHHIDDTILGAVDPELAMIGMNDTSAVEDMKDDFDTDEIAWVHAVETPVWVVTGQPDGSWTLDTGPFTRPRPSRASAI